MPLLLTIRCQSSALMAPEPSPSVSLMPEISSFVRAGLLPLITCSLRLFMSSSAASRLILFTTERGNVLCGNSITQDRRFLYRYMPLLSGWLNYRNIDVSSIKELTFRWYPTLPEFEKMEKHQALDDIRESIAELEYYRKTIFKTSL